MTNTPESNLRKQIVALRAQVEELRRERDDLKHDVERHIAIASEEATRADALQKALRKAEDEVMDAYVRSLKDNEALQKDAERWRFVRDCGLEDALIVTELEGDDLDAAIDAAREPGK